MDEATGGWFDRDIAGCSFADERLNKRLRNLLERMGDAMGASIPLACQDWANTKAAYRFFSNDRFNEAEILAGHSPVAMMQKREVAVSPESIKHVAQGRSDPRVRNQAG